MSSSIGYLLLMGVALNTVVTETNIPVHTVNWTEMLPPPDQLVSANIKHFESRNHGVDEAVKHRIDAMYENASESILEDALLPVCGLANKYGYPCEVHTVETQDGYILTMHRIQQSRRNASTLQKSPVVFLMHGIMCSSADWVVTGPGHALAYTLTDAGFDVWMGNARGNTYSRAHKTLDTTSTEFWDFSWHEIGIYDLPAMIDYVLDAANEQQLTYIGHSQGTTVFYVLCSERPEYNKKFKASFSLSPVAYVSNLYSPYFMALQQPESEEILKPIIGPNMLNTSTSQSKGTVPLCSEGEINEVLCTNALFVTCGFDPKQLNIALVPVILAHNPAGCSTKQFIHYAQEMHSGNFGKFDYGTDGNIEKYNSPSPPDYAVENITVPIYFIYSLDDWISNKIDIDRLYERIQAPKQMILLTDPEFTHLDFLYGKNARKLVYNNIINIMNTL